MKTLIVSHDAGGANLLLYWASTQNMEFDYLVSGPAEQILTKLGIKEYYRCLNDVEINDYDQVISSTGWQTSFEVEAINKALENNVFCTAYLDHWVNYRERFVFGEKLVLPNQIWVVDKQAKEIAESEFLGLPITVVDNQYENTLISGIEKHSETRLLICLEPIRNRAINVNEIMTDLALHLIANFKDWKFRIRRHPSGEEDGFNALTKELEDKVIVEEERDQLIDDLNDSSAVLGYQSSVFSLANKTNRKVFSYFPKSSLKPLLPHSYINYLL